MPAADASTKPSSPSRGSLQRAARAVRSGLRRYPSAIVQSFTERSIPQPDQRCGRRLVDELQAHDFALMWLGHAGVACTLGRSSLIVDPVLSHRIGPRIAGRTIGLPRIAQPPVNASALLGTDLLLLTHAHFDHFDKPTLEGLASDATTAVVPRRCSGLLPRGFGLVVELRSGEEFRLGDLRVHAMQPRHWGARTAIDRARGVNAYLVRSCAGSVLFTGDSAQTDAFDALESVDVAVFGIGAYNPWDHMHATPEQAWSMFVASGVQHLLPVHHSTFDLSDEPTDEPLQRLLRRARAERHRVLTLQPGEVLAIDGGA